MNIKELLEKGNQILKEKNIEDSLLKCKILISHILKIDRSQIITNFDREISKSEEKIYFKNIEKLLENIPIQYITNSQEFYGENFYVDENVLIPQPDTEILVEEVINIAKKYNKYLKILDLCTGSGAIAISVSKNLNNVEMYASDISEDAINVAKINAKKFNCDIKFINSNLFDNINEKFDIIVSNPPYIETEVIYNLSDEVKKEPFIALDGKEDGLFFYREISKIAHKYLNEDGVLAFEIGYNQKNNVENLLKENNFTNIYSKKDLSGNDRIVVGNK